MEKWPEGEVVALEVGGWGVEDVGVVDNTCLGERGGKGQVQEDVEMLGLEKPDDDWEVTGIREVHLEAEGLQDVDGQEVAEELGEDLELVLAPGVGSSVEAELPTEEGLASVAPVQIEQVQTDWVVLASVPEDPAVGTVQHASFVVKGNGEIAEEETHVQLRSVFEAVQELEEKTVPPAPMDIAEGHFPTSGSLAQHHSAWTHRPDSKQGVTESPTVPPSQNQKTRTPLQQTTRNDVVSSANCAPKAPTSPLSTKRPSPSPSRPYSRVEHTLGFQAWG